MRTTLHWVWGHKKWISVGIVVFLLLFESSLRFFLGLGDPLLLQSDSEIGYFFKPDQEVCRFGHRIVINHYGQRNRDITETPEDGALRVMVVGDSVTFGGTMISQEDTFTEKLAAALRQTEGMPVEVLNASAGSWGIGNHLAYLERFGVFGSQVVVLQIGSHDLLQEKSTSEFVGIHPAKPDAKPVCATTELFSRYIVPRFIEPPGRAPSEDPVVLEQLFVKNMEWVKVAVDLARSQGARVCVLHTPDRDEVVPGPEGYATKYVRFRERFLSDCREWDVPVLNLLEKWRGTAAAVASYRDGVHFTPEGNRQIAAFLQEFLTEEKIVWTSGGERLRADRGGQSVALQPAER